MNTFIIRFRKQIGFAAVMVLLSLFPVFVKSPYYLDLVIITLVNAMLAMTFILTFRTGLMNLGLAAFWGLGSYISSVLVMKLNMSFWISMPLTGLIVAAIAVCIGYVLIGSGSGGFSFVMLSSVIGMLFVVTIGSIDYLGGYNGIVNIPSPEPVRIPFLPVIEFTSKVPFFYLALLIFIIIILIVKAFYSAWTGRAWTAIGMNPQLAETLGINIFRYKLLAFVLSTGLAGIIGSFFAHYEAYVIPDTYQMWINMYIQVYAILGGIGYVVLGPVVGSAVMTLFPELIRGIREVGPLVTGGLLVILILFMPSGLLGIWEKRGKVLGSIKKVFKK